MPPFTVNPSHKKWLVVFTMSLSLGMSFIDQTAVAIALPCMRDAFSTSSIALEWIVNAYLLTTAVFLSIGGRLGDIFLHHRVFITGLIIFLIASVLCAIAPNIVWLISNRAIQGIGAALMLPNTAVIIMNVFPSKEKGKAMGFYTGSALLFLPLALIMGGVFTQYVSWRLIFWINLPLCLLCLSIIYFLKIAAEPVKEKIKIDLLGMITLVITVASLVIALMEGGSLGWDSNIIKLLFFNFIIFFIIYCYIEQHNVAPLIDFHLFRNKIFLCAVILIFSGSTSAALFVFSAIFYQNVLGFQPALAGVLFFPNVLCVMLAAPLAGKIFDQRGFTFPVLLGSVFTIVGLLLNSYLVFYQNYWYLLPGIICINIGVPFILSPINTAAIVSVEVQQRGIVSGILNTARHVANSVSFAALTAIMVFSTHYFLTNASFVKQLLGFHADLSNKNAYTFAYSISLGVSAFIALLGLICTLFIFAKIERTREVK